MNGRLPGLLEAIDAAERERLAGVTTPGVDIRHGDFRRVLDDLVGKVDAVITDPPYERRWLKRDAADFAAWAARALKPGGHLAVLYGHLRQYELQALLAGTAGLDYRWTCAYLMPDSESRVFSRRVRNLWKPVLVFWRPDGGRPEWLAGDVFVSEAADKRFHQWGQSESGTAALVQAFSRPGDLVADPFFGGGTTAVACHKLGRRFVGCDIDERAVLRARARLVEVAK